MSDIQSVSMGETKISTAPTVLKTMGVGSCLVVVVYDSIAHVGGMAHALLPSKPASSEDSSPMRYVDAAIASLIDASVAAGARKDRLVAKLVGGAHMFSVFGDAPHGIGAQNVNQARLTLERFNVPIVAEETGGNVGRTIYFDLASGVCSVESHL